MGVRRVLFRSTPLPSPGDGAYRVRHGFGYSVYEHEQDGIASELWVYVARESPVKFSVLRVRNTGDGTLRLSATGYVEWILGDLHARTQMHVVTYRAGASGWRRAGAQRLQRRIRRPCRVLRRRNRRGRLAWRGRAPQRQRRPGRVHRPQRKPARAGGDGARDRKSVVSGKRVSVRVDLGGRRDIKNKKPNTHNN